MWELFKLEWMKHTHTRKRWWLFMDMGVLPSCSGRSWRHSLKTITWFSLTSWGKARVAALSLNMKAHKKHLSSWLGGLRNGDKRLGYSMKSLYCVDIPLVHMFQVIIRRDTPSMWKSSFSCPLLASLRGPSPMKSFRRSLTHTLRLLGNSDPLSSCSKSQRSSGRRNGRLMLACASVVIVSYGFNSRGMWEGSLKTLYLGSIG